MNFEIETNRTRPKKTKRIWPYVLAGALAVTGLFAVCIVGIVIVVVGFAGDPMPPLPPGFRLVEDDPMRHFRVMNGTEGATLTQQEWDYLLANGRDYPGKGTPNDPYKAYVDKLSPEREGASALKALFETVE